MDADGAAHVFRPLPRLVRYRGGMLHLVALATPRSVEAKARSEHLRTLRELEVE